jgi:hypothetical protein
VPVILTIGEGPRTGTRFIVRNGQVARVGSTDLADFCVPDDDQLAAVHFAVRCDAQACSLRNLAPGAATRLNEQPVEEETPLHDGDAILAGSTRFEVGIEGLLHRTATKPHPLGGDEEDDPTAAAVRRIVAVAQQADLSEASRSLVVGQHSASDALEALVAAGQRDDAMRFLAYWLERKQAVWWTCLCVKMALGDAAKPPQQAALDAARDWVVDPNEEHRLAALTASRDKEAGTLAAWAARTAVWNSDNISGEGLPQVPPPEGLGPKAVLSTLTVAVAAAGQDEADGRRDQFIRRGVAILNGEESLPS